MIRILTDSASDLTATDSARPGVYTVPLSVTFADGMCMDVRCIPRKNGPSWCEAAIYCADEDVVTSEPYNSFYNHWVCQTANATYHLYMGVADTE